MPESKHKIVSGLIKSIDSSNRMIWKIPTRIVSPVIKIEIDFRKITNASVDFTLEHAVNNIFSDLILDKSETKWDTKRIFTLTFAEGKKLSHLFLKVDGFNRKTLEMLEIKVKIYVENEVAVRVIDDEKQDDFGAASFLKTVRTPHNQQDAHLLTDGSLNTIWRAGGYPAFADIDLEKEHQISEIEVYFPENQEVIYCLYGSTDGIDYERIIKMNTFSKKDGERIKIFQTYRYIRIQVLYNSNFSSVQVKQIRILGIPTSNRPIIHEKSKFNADNLVKKKEPYDVFDNLKGIVERRLGKKYVTWFKFEIEKVDEKNFFSLEQKDDYILLKGPTGVDIACGLNYYLKEFCSINISQEGVGDRVELPSSVVSIPQRIVKKNLIKYRYAYNFTTFSYTMPFWSELDWQNELDWLALSGINLVLDTTGQEYVWALFMKKLGYSDYEVQWALSDPTHIAWQWMGNLSGVGGPISPKWFTKRANLAKNNARFMESMGMSIVRMGYSGHVPDRLKEKWTNAQLIEQGEWCGFKRPDILRTDSLLFEKFAQLFYESQEEVFGKTQFFATDPFHEGGDSADIEPQLISRNVLGNMLKNNAEAVWVVQSWQENPSNDLMLGVSKYKEKHLLILDLYAEKTPHWSVTAKAAYGGLEFGKTPWLFCMLNNFGGRMGLSGDLDVLKAGYVEALAGSEYLNGIGVTPEASQSNPILFDYFFDLSWEERTFLSDQQSVRELDEWLIKYANRRYGKSANANKALKILSKTVYASKNNQLGQGAPESIINARPKKRITAASTWGNSEISYLESNLEQALVSLYQDYKLLESSAGYRFDLVTLTQQVLSNHARETLKKIISAHNEQDKEIYAGLKTDFFECINLVDRVSSQVSLFQLENWEKSAEIAATDLDDFSKDQFAISARAILTTWGSQKNANSGGLHDYSNRQWSGLTRSLYQCRWKKWFENFECKNLEISSREWFEIEWKWVLFGKVEPLVNVENLDCLVKKTLELIK